MDAMPSLRSVRLRFTVLALLALSAAPFAARAQGISVYGTVSPVYLNHLYTVNGTTSSLAGQWLVGANAGVTLTFAQSGNVSMGLDFRGGPEIGTPGVGSALAGFKLGFQPPKSHFKPYGQFSLGWLEQRHNTGTGSFAVTDAESYFAVELLGGVDYPVAHHLDLRLVEAGVGTTRRIVTNGINTSTRPAIVSLNSGIVYTF